MKKSENKISEELQIVLGEKSVSDIKNKKLKKIFSKVEEINVLKNHLVKDIKEFDKIRKMYWVLAKKPDTEYCKIKENHILGMSDKFFDKAFAKWHKELLYEMIIDQYKLLEQKDYTSDVLDENRKKVVQYYNDVVNPMDKQKARQMYDELKKNGFGKDDKDFTPENLQDPDFRKKFGKQIEEEALRREEEERLKKIRSRTLETDLDFHTIYKKLVKLVHPDLVDTEEEKEHREYLMKRLTVAWEKRDYYEVLLLHKLIDRDNTIDIILNDENAENIIRNLNEKIEELKYERFMTTSRYGENAFYSRFYSRYEVIIKEKIEEYVGFLEESAERTKKLMEEKFKNKSTVKRYLQEYYEEFIA